MRFRPSSFWFVDSPRLEHVRVNVSHFGRAVTWSEAILGLPAAEPLAARGTEVRSLPDRFDPVRALRNGTRPRCGPIQLQRQDVDAWSANLRDRAEVVEPLVDTPYGTRKFTIRNRTETNSGSSQKTDELIELPADRVERARGGRAEIS